MKDCRAQAERRGWLVAEEYVADATSALLSEEVATDARHLLDELLQLDRAAV